MTLYIGLMSGTSMDGIDAALIRMPGHHLVCGMTKSYSVEVRRKLDEVVNGINLSLASICQLNTLIGQEFAAVTNELLQRANVSAQEISAIGSHGQTVCHDASADIPYTLQLGCGHTIAAIMDITVIADFRTRDLVNGGQGAPFAPLYHHELFKQSKESVAVVNLGGISNVSFISASKSIQGWDIGPANCLMDAWIFKHKGESFDVDGQWARQGNIITSLLEYLLSDPFFALASPKSIGKEYFSLSWLQPHLKDEYNAVDVQATLLALTAHTIAQTLVAREEDLNVLYLCGGGSHNGFLHSILADLLPGIDVISTAAAGIDPDYLEAMMFAWLASQTFNKISVDLSSITGSKGPEILGSVYLP